MLILPENAHLGTAYSDVSFYAGKDAKKQAEALDHRYFQNPRAENGFVNADLTLLGLNALLSQIPLPQNGLNFDDLTEDDLFSPAIRLFCALSRRANDEITLEEPFFKAKRRRLLLRLIAAQKGHYALSEEIALCEQVEKELKTSFLSEEDKTLGTLCALGSALLYRRLNGGIG